MTDTDTLRRLAMIVRLAAAEIEELADEIDEETEPLPEPVVTSRDNSMFFGFL